MKDSMERLPESCIAHIVSLTTPLDACRLISVSRLWRSAADSDVVWKRFLPSCYLDILVRADNPVEYSSMKDLFFRLCEPILIDGGKKMVSLNRSTGKLSMVLSPDDLTIDGENGYQSVWDSIPISELSPKRWSELGIRGNPPRAFRFPEISLLLHSSSSWIYGYIPAMMLTSRTYYSVRVIFRMAYSIYGIEPPIHVALVQEDIPCFRRLCFNSEVPEGNLGNLRGRSSERMFPLYVDLFLGLALADRREDGWFQVEIGRFFFDGEIRGEDDEIWFCMVEKGEDIGGLLLEGVEVSPMN